MSTPQFIVEDMLRGYIEAALFTSTDESDEGGGEPLDKRYGPSDLAPAARRSMKKDIVKFLRDNRRALLGYEANRRFNPEHGSVWEHAGHDFWLTRNRSGTGFWDRDYGGHNEIGEQLTKAAHKFGESHLYVDGADGMIHVMG